MTLKAIKGDITKLKVEAIVNPGNPATKLGGGLCHHIWMAADWPVWWQFTALGLQPGQCYTSEPGTLPCEWVIHTVGPDFRLYGKELAMKLLHQTYKNIVIAADIENIKSVAIPSISTGIYGFPPILAAGIAVDACRNAPLDITLVAFDDETLKLYQELI